MRLLRSIPFALLLLTPACDKSKEEPAPAQGKRSANSAEPEPTKAEAKAPAPEPKPEPKPKEYGGEFCAVIVPCYEKSEFSGSFTADVTVDISADGSVTAVSYAGGAPKPIESCIIATIKPMKLADYNSKPGRTTCNQSGQLSGGTRMVMADMKYEIREDGDAKAPEPAEPDEPAEPARQASSP